MADAPPPAPSSQAASRPRVEHWGPTLAILAALGLYLILPDRLAIGPHWLIPAIEGVLVGLLSIFRTYRRSHEETEVRWFVIGVIALLNIANMVSVGLLVVTLLYGNLAKGRPLLYGAVSVWLTNIIVYALWFWQLDRGGPLARAAAASATRTSSSPRWWGRRPSPSPVPRPRGHRPPGGRGSWTTSTWPSPTPQPSARPTRCRSRAPPRRSWARSRWSPS